MMVHSASQNTHREADPAVLVLHTPGPWSYRETPHDLDMAFSVDGPRAPVCDIYGPDIAEASRAQVEANARLVAAAPYLLRALLDAVADGLGDDWRARARAALVKALGPL